MPKFIIEGGHPLSGTVTVGGNKNAVLPIMAACLLTQEECRLTNVPAITDVVVMAKIMRELGVKVSGVGETTLTIRAREVQRQALNPELVAQLRAAVLFIGPLLKRIGIVKMRHPGGCIIGRRGIESHIDSLSALQAQFVVGDDRYEARTNGLVGADIFLSEASVTATENTVMAAVLARGRTVIRNAASEPHVEALCTFLNRMGGNVQGGGSNVITIEGRSLLHGTDFSIPPDHIEVGTWAVASAVTKGTVEVKNIEKKDLDKILLTLGQFGVKTEVRGRSLFVLPSTLTAVRKVETNIWPGFPTDLMSVTVTLATQARGTTLCHDWMYEGRMFFVDKLIQMGAKIILSDPHRAVVTGPTPLRGKSIESPDLRAGMALIIAALAAKGRSEISHAELIDRGYANIETRLRSLGANIRRVR